MIISYISPLSSLKSLLGDRYIEKHFGPLVHLSKELAYQRRYINRDTTKESFYFGDYYFDVGTVLSVDNKIKRCTISVLEFDECKVTIYPV